ADKERSDALKELDGEFVTADCKKMNVMVIARSCALDNPKRKHILVAPDLAVLLWPEPQRSTGKLEELIKNGIPHFFYLPAYGDLAESYADLLRMEPVHRSFFEIDIFKYHPRARPSATDTDALHMSLSDHYVNQLRYSE